MVARFNRVIAAIKVHIAELVKRHDLPPNISEELNEEISRILEAEREITETELVKLQQHIAELETQRTKLDVQNANLRSSRTQLINENTQLKQRIEVFEAKRPKYSPTQLIVALNEAVTSMQDRLTADKKGHVNYSLNEFSIDLKANVGLGPKQEVLIQTPELTEEVSEQAISTIHLSMKAIPSLKSLEPTVFVPNLIGKQWKKASVTLKDAELTVGTIIEQASSLPPGTVIGQDPPPYGKASPGYPINVILSVEAGITVPTLVGLELETAQKLIIDSQLTVGTITETAVTTPPGIILAQSVSPGSKVPQGHVIDLTVSKQPTVIVPNVMNKDRRTAIKELANVGLKARSSRRRDTEVTEDVVLEQDPPPNTEVPLGTTIKLICPQILRREPR